MQVGQQVLLLRKQVKLVKLVELIQLGFHLDGIKYTSRRVDQVPVRNKIRPYTIPVLGPSTRLSLYTIAYLSLPYVGLGILEGYKNVYRCITWYHSRQYIPHLNISDYSIVPIFVYTTHQ